MHYYRQEVSDYPDCVFVKKLNETRCYNMDTMLMRYAQYGYESCIDEWIRYYTEILPHLSEDKKRMMEKKADDAISLYENDGLRNEIAFMKAMHLSHNGSRKICSKVATFQKIVDDSEDRGDICMKIRAMAEILKIYRTATPSDYPKGFMQAVLLVAELNKTTKEQFPEIDNIYYYIGETYYLFQDYDRAIFFLKKASAGVSSFFYDNASLKSCNLLGLHYSFIGELEKSDFYFRMIFNNDDSIKHHSLYRAVSMCNIAENIRKKGDYRHATYIMTKYLPEVVKGKKYFFASKITMQLAECHLAGNNLEKTKAMLDSTRTYLNRLSYISYTRLCMLYPLMNKYHAAEGNSELAKAYMDSSLIAESNRDKKYNTIDILRGEQKLFEFHAKEKNKQIRLQKNQLRTSIIIIALSACCLFIIIRLYHRKQISTQLLTLDTEKPTEEALTKENNFSSERYKESPDKKDMEIFNILQNCMVNEKLFKDSGLTLESLSNRLDIPRNCLSQAINKCAGKNFNQYVNDYRIKEAINMMSDPKYKNILVDDLAEQSGFNSRTSFYRIFKNVTGSKPTQWKRK